MMKIYPVRIPTAVLCVLACSIVLVSWVTAADCDRPVYPNAMFTCTFPVNPAHPGNPMPDGPPYSINCYDQSHSEQDIASWKWEFGDGGTSTRQSPGHTYTDTGSYQITLTVTTVCGSYYASTAVDSMDVYCTIPEPQFTVDVDKGVAPLTVHVHDSSINTPNDVTKWNTWYDNAHNSIDPDPIFVFTRPGIYTIKQTVKKDCVRPGLRLPPPFEHTINVTSPVASIVGVYFNLSTTTTPPVTTSAGPGALRANAQPPTIIPRTTLTGPVTATAPPASVTGQATPAPGTGSLAVTTDPAGAQVFIDDVLRGASPATVPGLSAGSHTLRLEKEGYRNLMVPVGINDGKTTAYSTALVPESGSSTVTLPFIAMAVGIFILAGTAAYLYGKKKKSP